MTNKYKLYKVFDCQDMPDDIKQLVFDVGDERCLGNDSSIEWYFEEDCKDLGSGYKEIQDWLLNNGAELGDRVLIKHWW